MRFPEYCFVDTAFGGANHRNKPMRLQDVLPALPSKPIDCHTTWRRFPQAYLDHHARNNNSVGKYDGLSYADYLPLDIDVAGDLDAAHKLAMSLLASLESDYGLDLLQSVRCFFSGSKGFHICVAAAAFGGWAPDKLFVRRHRQLALRVAGDITVDTDVYDVNRLWRIPNTINSRTGLFKIPLATEEILSFSIPDIQELAQGPRETSWPPLDKAPINEGLYALWQAVKATKQDKAKIVAGLDIFKADLHEGDGRDVQAFSIACRLRDWGVPSTGATAILNMWDASLETPLTATDGDDVLIRKIQNAYGDTATEERITPEAVLSITELADEYSLYVKNLKARTVRLGFPSIDKYMRGIAPGEVCTVIAKTSVGKTAFSQNVIRNIALQAQQNVLFCSMEQPKAQVFERFAQIVTDRAGEEIEAGWEREDYDQAVIRELVAEMGRNNVWTCDVPRLKMAEIEQLAHITKEKSGRAVDVIVVDYLGLLDAKDLDRSLYGQVSEAARQMKTLAKKVDVAIIVLCQISRSPDDHGNKPLHLSSARESGAIEEAADFMLGLYRPNIEKQDEPDDEMVIQLLKNRKGRTGAMSCNFDGNSLRITERAKVPDPGGNGRADYQAVLARQQGERDDKAYQF